MPVTAKQIKAFAAKVRGMKSEAVNLSDETRSRVYRVVDSHRKSINDAIRQAASNEGKELTSAQTPRLSDLIRAESREMSDEIRVIIQDAQNEGIRLAVDRAQAIADTVEIDSAFFSPSAELASIANRYAAELVSTITPDLMPEVDAILSRAAMGTLSPFEAMRGIDVALGRNGDGGVSYQAERIVRTEVNRIYNVTLDSQLQSLAAELPNPKELRKVWVSGPYRPGRRESHQEMNGETVPYNEPFSNGLMFPGDPSGDASETINCGCGWTLESDSIIDAFEASS